MTTCTAQNGTYCCEREASHIGPHSSTFWSCGKRKLATWTSAFSTMKFSTVR